MAGIFNFCESLCQFPEFLLNVIQFTESAYYIDYTGHPITTDDFPKFSQLVHTGRFVVGVKQDMACIQPDTLIFDAQNVSSNGMWFPLSSTEEDGLASSQMS